MSKVFKKPARPTADETTDTGDVTDTGLVLVSKLTQLNFDNDVIVDGQKTNDVRGELRIVKLTFGFEKYEVQMNGQPIYNGNGYTRFETLAEAADWAGF